MSNIIGRKVEINLLNKLYGSDKSEFAAVYGRRRVGKTFLIRSVFEKKFTFQITGLANASLSQQISNFNIALQKHDPQHSTPATDWLAAFQQLIVYLEKSKEKRKVIFFDELPWFDTPKSGFLSAFEHFWNSWASGRKDILLIACGSATSWIINKLINNKGGLHNRVTKRIKVLPFTLAECESFVKLKKINLDRYQITQLYMAFGGIPFYWEEVEKGQSATQNIDRICFTENGLLRNEYNNLYASLFGNPEKHITVIEVLAKKSIGLTRQEIIKFTGLPNAGSTTRILNELEESGFIRKYTPFNNKLRNSLYQLNDFYSLFYIKFIENSKVSTKDYWINLFDSPKYRAWSGYAFEQVCLYHVEEIKKALGISGIQTSISSWRSHKSENKSQIDLVIDRRDQVINICEIKYSINPFTISKKYVEELRNKIGNFKSETKTKKSIFLTLITTYGTEKNKYYGGLVQNEVIMEDLFTNP